jgi:mitogen-activated protein kinase kinase
VRLRGTAAVFALKVAHYPAGPDAGEEHDEALRRARGSPHVVRCHAVLRGDRGEPACLLELMDAGPLDAVLLRRGRGGLPEPALAEVAARCVAGLAHLHSRGVAHLDLKPDNILASARGDTKIGDFSVSRIFSLTKRSRVSIAVGTTAYMSPERFAPDAQAGPRGACAADVWSLGLTVLELFLGHRPFLPAEERPSWKMLKEAICQGEPPSVPENAGASAQLRGFVAACLQKEPRRRATVAQLLVHPFVASRDVQASRRALREIVVETMEE